MDKVWPTFEEMTAQLPALGWKADGCNRWTQTIDGRHEQIEYRLYLHYEGKAYLESVFLGNPERNLRPGVAQGGVDIWTFGSTIDLIRAWQCGFCRCDGCGAPVDCDSLYFVSDDRCASCVNEGRLRVARIVDPKRLELGKIEIVDADDCKKIDKPIQSAAY
jgi:hypothetical protein